MREPTRTRVNIGPDANINVTPETRRYRQQAIDGMKQAQASQRQAAHAALLAAKEKKDRAARREARKCA